MYHLLNMPSQIVDSFEPNVNIIYVDNDGLHWTIPPDPANSDYQQYLAWVAEGNTAEEWSPDATI